MSGKVKLINQIKVKKKFGVKSLIKDLERDELIEILVELSRISKKNEQFIRLFIQGSDTRHKEKIVREAKVKLKSIFFGQGTTPYEHVNL